MATLSAATKKCFDENMAKQIAKAEPIIKERCERNASKDLERAQKHARAEEEKMMKAEDKNAANAKKEAARAAKEAEKAAEKARKAEETLAKRAAAAAKRDADKAEKRAAELARREAEKAARNEEKALAAAKLAEEKALAAAKKEEFRQKVNAKIKKYMANIDELKGKSSDYMKEYGKNSERYKKVREAIATLEQKIKDVKAVAKSQGLHTFASPKTKKAVPLLIRKTTSSATRRARQATVAPRSKSVPRATSVAVMDEFAEMTPLKSRKSSRPKSVSPSTRKSKPSTPVETMFEFEEEEVKTPGGMTELVEMVGSPVTAKSKSKTSSSIKSY